MSGPWRVTTARLEALASALRGMGDELTVERCQARGFSDELPGLRGLLGLPATTALAAVEAVLAGRSHRPGPRLTLVWTGPDAVGTTARATQAVVRELFSSAEEHVLVAGYAFYNAAAIFEPLHERIVTRRRLVCAAFA